MSNEWIVKEIIDNIPTTYAILDLNYRIQRINKKGIAFINEMGNEKYAPEVSLLSFFNHPEKVVEHLSRATAGESFSVEHKIKSYWFEFSFSPYMNKEKEIVGTVISGRPISKRKENESELRHRLDFELLISLISSKFITLENISHSIDFSLEMVGRFSGSSRAYIFEFNDATNTMSNTFEWCDTGVIAEIDQLQNLPNSTFPWWMEQLNNRKIIQISDVAQLGEEAKAEKEILEMQGIQSVLVLPLQIQGNLIGFIGLDNVTSTNIINGSDIHLLRVVSEIFSNAFVRLFGERNLKSTNNQLQSALDQLEVAQSQVLQQEKMVAIGQLAAGVAHEINNPMAYVINNLAVLKDNVGVYIDAIRQYQDLVTAIEDNPCKEVESRIHEIRQYEMESYIEEIITDNEDLLSEISEGHDRISKIVKSLRSFSHVDIHDEHQLYNINDCVKTTLTVANNKLKYTVDVEKDLKSTTLIPCDPGEINQVLLNLVLNSHYAMEKNETVKKGILKVSTFENQDSIYIKLTDNGVGIPKDIQNKIFNPFFTTKPIGEGTGLGMSIAYDIIVNKHKGEISIESVPMEGATFTIRLPKDASAHM